MKTKKKQEEKDYKYYIDRKYKSSVGKFFRPKILPRQLLPFRHPSYRGNFFLNCMTITVAVSSMFWGVIQLDNLDNALVYKTVLVIVAILLILLWNHKLVLYSRYYTVYGPYDNNQSEHKISESEHYN